MRHYLIELREQRNESQQDVANVIGISRQYYAMIESGERQRKMDITLLADLAKHFQLSITALLSKEQAYLNTQ